MNGTRYVPQEIGTPVVFQVTGDDMAEQGTITAVFGELVCQVASLFGNTHTVRRTLVLTHVDYPHRPRELDDCEACDLLNEEELDEPVDEAEEAHMEAMYGGGDSDLFDAYQQED